MRKLLNTLYITQELAYLSLDGENIVISIESEEKFRIPFCNIESIVCFNYLGASPALMGKCAAENISLCFMSPSGRFLARVTGPTKGSVHLRRAQYEKLCNDEVCLELSKSVIATKLQNTVQVLSRCLRDHESIVDSDRITAVIDNHKKSIRNTFESASLESIRGIEGECARHYFSVFDELILKNKKEFALNGRTKRPPLDRTSAMLSYFYTILSFDIQSALETVGLDPYIGFFHSDRSGRASLSTDLIEELRAFMVDRYVLSSINLQQVKPDDFLLKEGGGVLMTDECRKKLLAGWQNRKNEIIKHPVIEEKINIGLIPYVQANLLAKFIRGELKEYIPFVMR